MPISIGNYRGDLQGSGDNAVLTSDKEVAAQAGENLGTLAKASTEVSQIMDKVDAQDALIEHTDKQLKLSAFQNNTLLQSSKIENDAYASDPGDGKSLVPSYTTGFDKYLNDVVNNEADPELRQLYANQGNKLKAERVAHLFVDSRAMYAKHADLAFQEQINQGDALISKNPLNFDKVYPNIENLIKNSGMMGKDVVLQKTRAQYASAAINASINGQDFDGAKKMVTDKFASFLDPKTQQQFMDEIQTKKVKSFEIALKDDTNSDRKAQDLQTQIEAGVFKDRLANAKQLRIKGLDAGAKDVQAFNDTVDGDIQAGTLKPSMGDLLKKVVQNDDNTDHNVIAADYFNELGTLKNGANFKSRVLQSAQAGDLSTETAMNLVEHADILTAQGQVNSKLGKSLDNKKLENAVQFINSSVPKGWSPKQQSDNAETKREMIDSLYKGLQGGAFRDPMKGAQFIINKRITPHGLDPMGQVKTKIDSLDFEKAKSYIRTIKDDATAVHALEYLKVKNSLDNSKRANKDGQKNG